MLIGSVWVGTLLPLVIAGFFVLMTAQGVIVANAGALASAEVPEHPGTGSAVLGFVQWVAAGAIAPIAGLGGEDTAVPMALLMVAGAVASMVGLLVIARGKSVGGPVCQSSVGLSVRDAGGVKRSP